jgi:hypothetical protein
MKRGLDWSRLEKRDLIRAAFKLGGNLEVLCKVVDLPSDEVHEIARELCVSYQPYTRKGVAHGCPVRMPVRDDASYRELARRLNEEVGVSRYNIGQCLGAYEAIIVQISREDAWIESPRYKGLIKSRGLSDEDRDNIVVEYTKTLTINPLAIKYGVSRQTIRNALIKRGAELVGCRIDFDSTEKERIVASYKAGTGARAIAINLGVDPSVIERIVRESGVRLRGVREDTALKQAAHYKRVVENYPTGRFNKDCRKLTELMYKNNIDALNPDGRKRGHRGDAFHLDHRYSINEAALEGGSVVNIWEVCHPANLSIIRCRDNMKKGRKSEFSRVELIERINEWNNSNLDPYFQVATVPLVSYIREIYGEYENCYAGIEGCTSEGRYYKTCDGV